MLEHPRSSPPIASCPAVLRTEEHPCWLGRGTPLRYTPSYRARKAVARKARWLTVERTGVVCFQPFQRDVEVARQIKHRRSSSVAFRRNDRPWTCSPLTGVNSHSRYSRLANITVALFSREKLENLETRPSLGNGVDFNTPPDTT